MDVYEYLLEKQNELSDNKVLRLIINFWYDIKNDIKKYTDKKNNFDNLLIKYNQLEEYKKINHENNLKKENTEFKDLRIKTILLNSVRGISPKKIDYPEISYGIDFYKNNNIASAILIGNNGSGKSSVFSALEKIYTGDIGERLMRNADEKYLFNTNTDEEPYCQIDTASGLFDLKTPIYNEVNIQDCNPDSSFISEYDIYSHSQISTDGSNNSLSDLIASKVGLAGYLELQEYCNIINKYKRSTEKSNFNRNTDRRSQINLDLKNLKLEIKKLKSDKRGSNSEDTIKFSESISKTISHLETKNINNIKVQKLNNDYIELTANFAKYKLLSTTNSDSFINFYQQGLKLLSTSDDCPFCNKSELTKSEIKKNIEDEIDSNHKVAILNETTIQLFKSIVLEINLLENNITQFSNIVTRDLDIQFESNTFNEYKKEINSFLNGSKFIEYVGDIKEIINNKSSFYDNDYRDFLYGKIRDFIDSFDLNEEYSAINRLIDFRDLVIKELLPVFKDLLEKFDNSELQYKIQSIEEKIVYLEKEYEGLAKEETYLKNQYDLYSNIKLDIKELYLIINADINELVKAKILPLESVIKNTMKPFLLEDKVELKIMTEKGIKIYLQKDNYTFTPKAYFNNARYKIFCGGLAIAISLASRKSTGINLPLVMDDEFFDCDIINRVQFEKFFFNILELYKEITPDMPLQFILFTHDELIFDSARKAIKRFNSNNINTINNNENLLIKSIYGRLFPSHKTSSKYEYTYSDNEYWNLIHEFKNGDIK